MVEQGAAIVSRWEAHGRSFGFCVIQIGDEPWFCVRDIADTLGISNVTTLTANLGNSKVSAKKLSKAQHARPNKIVSERGFYEIVSRAHRNNPKAREFQDWVFGTVLPAIRKDGGYIENEEKVVTGEVVKGQPEESLN